MLDFTKPLKKPIYQHILPVIIKETGIVLGCVQIPYTRFVDNRSWKFWPNSDEVYVQCLTNSSGQQAMVIAYNQSEQRKVQLLKNFTSVKTMPYTSIWRITKSQVKQEVGLGLLTPLISGFVWDSQEDYISNTSPNHDYSGDDHNNPDAEQYSTMKWKVNVSYNQFIEDYGFADLTWLEFFNKACLKRSIDETPQIIVLLSKPDEVKVTFLYDVMQTNSDSVPAIMRVLKLRNMDKGVYPIKVYIKTNKTLYYVTINMVIA